MTKPLGRWSVSDVSGIPTTRIGASPGAFVRQITGDAAPLRRGRDQEPEEEGELVCRLAQTGADRWHGTTPDGRRVAIRRISDGSLEIRHLTEGAGEGEAGDNVFGQEDPPGAASIDALRRRMAPRAVHDEPLTSTQQQNRLKAWQAYNDKMWAPRS